MPRQTQPKLTAKQRVFCREYLVDYYGPNESHFNKGLETDRFQVEWWIASPRVLRCVGGQRPEATADREVEIPEDIDALKERDLQEARRRRAQTREQLQAALAEGYVVGGLARREGRSFLTLEKKPLNELLA